MTWKPLVAMRFETCLHERTSVKNRMQRVQGYSPAQWVLGRNPRIPGSVTDMDEAGKLGHLGEQA